MTTPYANFAYFVESGLLDGKSSFLLWAADVWRKWDIKLCGEIFSFFFLQATESITMIYRDMLKVNYVVNACPMGQLRITRKKCKKFEIPNSEG